VTRWYRWADLDMDTALWFALVVLGVIALGAVVWGLIGY
jgi:hypothetical protein